MKIRFLHGQRGVTVSAFIQGGALAGLTGDLAYNRHAALKNLRAKVEEVEDEAKSLIDAEIAAALRKGLAG